MKTTFEIPDSLFERAKLTAAELGISLQDLVLEALTEKLSTRNGADKSWRKSFGKLRHLREETARINRVIEEEFGVLGG